MKGLLRFTPFVTHGILLLTLGFLLVWRLNVGMTRFFDVDEFSYLHWVGNLAKGHLPYVDYFMFFPPGFLVFFLPLFVLFPGNPEIFLAGRVLSLIIFIALLVAVSALYGRLRSWKYALLPVILLSFLPMPYDKLLEIRPDNLSTLLAVAGVTFQVYAGMDQSRKARYLWAAAGVFQALSLIVFPKTLPFTVVTSVCALWYFLWFAEKKSGAFGDRILRTFTSQLLWFAVGFVVPMVLLLLWLLTYGNFTQVWYSLTRLPFEANRISKFYIMEPHLFFFPNGSFYGAPGLTNGFLANHLIWAVGICIGIVRFFTPFVTADGDRRKVVGEVITGGSFLLLSALYVMFYPLKHSQYLIPIAVFVVFYAADGLEQLLRWLEGKVHPWAAIGVLGVVAAALVWITPQVNGVKLGWSNADQLRQLRLMTQIVPKDATVFDIEGRMVFWNDAYYICCVPFGSFIDQMSRQPAPLSLVLEDKKVPYLYQGDTGRIYTLPVRDRVYIQQYYTPVEGWGETFWKRK